MYNENINLTPQDILDKDFNVDTRGYRPQEVDKFLDIVIKDYTEYISMVKKLQKENRLLEEEITHLKQEIRKIKEIEDASNEVSSNTTRITNLDILKRISNLEKTVYGKDQ
ncbi:MAG: cell division regulator GpsB [Bacilli bacterium]|nr:cell division regulator GpsB [Bacilli bacterium]